MTTGTKKSISERRILLTIVGVTATLSVFVVDILLPHGYDVSYLYALTVMVAAFGGRRTVVIRTMVGVWLLSATAFAIKEYHQPHGVTATEVFSRLMAAVVIVLIVLVLSALMKRDTENSALGRALRDAEGDRALDKRMLAAASAVATIGTWSLDAQEDLFEGSDGAIEMFGFSSGHVPSRQEVLELMSPQDAARVQNALENAWVTGLPFREEIQIRRPDGAVHWIVAMGEPIRREDDVVARLHGTVQDITPWKHAELSAADHGHRFAQLTDSLPIVVWTANAAGKIEYFNDALLHHTGADADGLLSDQGASVIYPPDLDTFVTAWHAAVDSGTTFDAEYRLKGPDGEFLWYHSTAVPERDSTGGIVRWWGSSINIDANKRLSQEADDMAEEREVILETMTEGVYALDDEYRFVYVNSSAFSILDLKETSAEVLGRVLWEVFPELAGGEFCQFLIDTKSSGAPAFLSYHSVLANRWLEVSATPTTQGITVFFRDATEVRQLSEQLALSQRLESIGQLTGGIAHDFNNLLTVVLGGADALTADESLSDESREMAALIGSAAERGAELTHRLLAFARRQPLEPQSVDISDRLHQLGPLLRRTLGEDIRIEMSTADAAQAEVDPGQFENALLNLAINSRDAMPHGGVLNIEVDNVTLDESYVTAHASVTPGTYVLVTVTDSGIGVDPEDMATLFDPFFTTKETSKGSGLGLAMVWGFVKQSGGHITVYSEKDYGTSFKMYLPAAVTAPLSSSPVSSQIPTGRASGTVLLAEDDDLVRVFATDRLRAKGYTVVAAASGPEALTALESMEHLDLLFTDVKMPGGMSGRELATAVLEKCPGTPVLYASGYTENVITHNDRLDPGVQFLAKPYSTKQLIERIGYSLAKDEETS